MIVDALAEINKELSSKRIEESPTQVAAALLKVVAVAQPSSTYRGRRNEAFTAGTVARACRKDFTTVLGEKEALKTFVIPRFA